MKMLRLLFVLTFIVAIHFSCSSQNLTEKVELSEIKILNPKMDSLLNIVIKNTKEFSDSHKDYYLLYVIKQDSDYNIHISITSKTSFEYAYHLRNFKIEGFCTIKNQDVLVLDKFYPSIMKRSNVKKIYDFFDIKKNYKKYKVPPPPPLSNSTVFNFLLKENEGVILLKE